MQEKTFVGVEGASRSFPNLDAAGDEPEPCILSSELPPHLDRAGYEPEPWVLSSELPHHLDGVGYEPEPWFLSSELPPHLHGAPPVYHPGVVDVDAAADGKHLDNGGGDAGQRTRGSNLGQQIKLSKAYNCNTGYIEISNTVASVNL